MSADVELVRQVIVQLVHSLGDSDAASDRVADELIATALRVTPEHFRTWREDPRLTPLDYRLAMSIWIESTGRTTRVDSLRELGRHLREATQRERAAHMIVGSLRYADWPRANRGDLAMAYAEVQCRRSPPPPTPIVEEYPLRVMFEQLLVRDEEHFTRPAEQGAPEIVSSPGPDRPIGADEGSG